MKSPSTPLFREATRLLSTRLFIQQIGLALAIAALCALWLRIPDASILDVAASAMLGVMILALAGAGESFIMLGLAGHKVISRSLLRGTLLLVAAVALWLGLAALLDRAEAHDELLAGFLNSRFPHTLRAFFSYNHVVAWLHWLWTLAHWIAAGLLGAFLFIGTTCDHPGRALRMALRSFTYWLVLILGTAVASAVTGALLGWTPGHGLPVEMLSLVLRLGIVLLINALLVCLLLSLLAAFVRRSDLLYRASAGTPEEIQPRTAGIP